MKTHVAIVGAGPIGLELAVALKQAGVEYVHLDAGQIGQTVSWYPRQARFFSSPERIAIAGVPLHTTDQSKATREEYLTYLRSVVLQYDLPVRTYERVTGIEKAGEGGRGFRLRTASAAGEREYEARYVVLAVGDMAAPRRLNVPGEDLPHVSHYFDEPHRYFRKRVLIVGGRNSAVEAAIRCHRAGAQVRMSYRKQRFDPKAIKYWLLPEIESLIQVGKVGFHPCTLPVEIAATEVVLAAADGGGESGGSRGAGGGARQHVAADFVLLLTGYVADTTLFRLAACRLEGVHQSPAYHGETMETSVPGVFVAGTAAAGSQAESQLFIENCHVHVERIVKAITGHALAPPVVTANRVGMPES